MTERELLELEIARIREDNRRRDAAREEEGNRARDEERDRLAREERRREELEDYRRELERERLDALEADLAGCRYVEAALDSLGGHLQVGAWRGGRGAGECWGLV